MTDQHLCHQGQVPANWKWCSSKWQIGSENAHPACKVYRLKCLWRDKWWWCSPHIQRQHLVQTYIGEGKIMFRGRRMAMKSSGRVWEINKSGPKEKWMAGQKCLASAGSYMNSLILKQEGLETGRKVTLSQPSYGVNNRWERGSRPVHWKSCNVLVFLLSALPHMHTHLTCVCARTLSAHHQAQTNHSSHFNGKVIPSLRGSLLCARLNILYTRAIHQSSQPGSASSLQRAGPPSLHQLLDDEKNENKFLPN